jgi:CDP-glucose 4,6-dehydratase
MGHDVSGFSLDAEVGSLFSRMEPESIFSNSIIGDIRSLPVLESALEENKPEVVLHLAAQSLVRESYRNPLFTYETNVNGSLNVLKSIEKLENPPLVLMITTDKVYSNDGRRKGYVESDELGGKDPYSSSKAIADLLVQSWQTINPGLGLAIARAGNVIGGGDASKERLLPDLIKSMENGDTVNLRSPRAVRPWQHVLDCLSGYLVLVEHMAESPGSAGAWNFGPELSQVRTVEEVAEKVSEVWGTPLNWSKTSNDGLAEAEFLLLDSSKARTELNWRDKFDFNQAIEWTVRWHLKVKNGLSARAAMEEDIEAFLSIK